MAYCCVPLCRSDWKKKEPGISFHEIPAEASLREQWLKKIRRDDWVPNCTSNYSRVCSKHFTDSDFLEGKRRRLKKGVVPSVFADYLPCMQPPKLKERNSESIRKRSALENQHSQDEPTKKRKGSDENSIPEVSASDVSRVAGCPPMPSDNFFNVTQEHLSCISADQDEALMSKQHADKATQVDFGSANLLTVERMKWKRKKRDLKKQIERLGTAVVQYQTELKRLKEDSGFGDIAYI